MPKLNPDQWEEVRASRETGASFGSLARRFGISRQGIAKRAKAEGWSDGADVAGLIRQQVVNKVAGCVDADPVKKAVALNQASDAAAEVVKLHRAEWQGHRGLFPLKDLAENFEKGKAAKISAEMIGIRQRHERQAWGLDNGNEDSIEIIIERSYGI